MDKYNKWLNAKNTIMYYYIFKTKDQNGSGLGVIVDYRRLENKLYSYKVHGNLDLLYLVGERSDHNIVVTNQKDLDFLSTLHPNREAINWAFFGETYYNVLKDKR